MAPIPLHKLMIQVEERGPGQRLNDPPRKSALLSAVSLVRSTYSDRKAEDIKPWHLSFDKLLHQLQTEFGYRLNLESDELGYLGLESSEHKLRSWQSIENKYGLETAAKELGQCPEAGKESASIHLYVFHPARNKPRPQDVQSPSPAPVQKPTVTPRKSFSASPSAPSSSARPDKSSLSLNAKTSAASNLVTNSQNPKVSSQPSSLSAENRRKARPTSTTGGHALQTQKQQAHSPSIGKSTSKKKEPQEDAVDEMEPPKSKKRKFTAIKSAAPYKRMTLKDFTLFKKSNDGSSIEVYNCSSGTYSPWDPENDVESANRLIWDAGREILRVQYFCTHQCTVEDLRPWIPDEYLYQAWSPSEWKQKISWSQSLYGGNTVLQTIGYKILPEWKKKADYPARRVAKSRAEKDEAKSRRMAFFDALAHSDSDALDTFMAPFNPSLDWETIRRRRNDTDKRIYDWAVRSLAAGANILWKLGIEEKPLPGQRGKPEESRKRTQKWLAVSTNGNPPPFSSIPLASLFWGAFASLEEGDEENIGNQSDAIEKGAEQARKKREAAPNLDSVRSSDFEPRPKSVARSTAKSPITTKDTSQPFRINGKFARKKDASSRATSTLSEETQRSDIAGTTSNPRKKSDEPLTANEDTSTLSTPLSSVLADSPFAPQAQISSAIVYKVEKTPKFTTSKVMKWTDGDVCKFLEHVMMISPVDVTTFASHYNGRLNGKLLLSLKCPDICGKMDMEIQSKQSRMWLCKVILQLQKRIQRNDEALRSREEEATEPESPETPSVDTNAAKLANPDKDSSKKAEKSTEPSKQDFTIPAGQNSEDWLTTQISIIMTSIANSNTSSARTASSNEMVQHGPIEHCENDPKVHTCITSAKFSSKMARTNDEAGLDTTEESSVGDIVMRTNQPHQTETPNSSFRRDSIPVSSKPRSKLPNTNGQDLVYDIRRRSNIDTEEDLISDQAQKIMQVAEGMASRFVGDVQSLNMRVRNSEIWFELRAIQDIFDVMSYVTYDIGEKASEFIRKWATHRRIQFKRTIKSNATSQQDFNHRDEIEANIAKLRNPLVGETKFVALFPARSKSLHVSMKDLKDFTRMLNEVDFVGYEIDQKKHIIFKAAIYVKEDQNLDIATLNFKQWMKDNGFRFIESGADVKQIIDLRRKLAVQ